MSVSAKKYAKVSNFFLFTSIQFVALYLLFSPGNNLNNLRKSHENLDFNNTIKYANELIENLDKLDHREKLKVYEIKAVAQFSTNDYEGAKESFARLLELNNKLSLDSSEVSPKIIDFFEGIKYDHTELSLTNKIEK